jgi:hypothetical protein
MKILYFYIFACIINLCFADLIYTNIGNKVINGENYYILLKGSSLIKDIGAACVRGTNIINEKTEFYFKLDSNNVFLESKDVFEIYNADTDKALSYWPAWECISGSGYFEKSKYAIYVNENGNYCLGRVQGRRIIDMKATQYGTHQYIRKTKTNLCAEIEIVELESNLGSQTGEVKNTNNVHQHIFIDDKN